MSLEIFTDPNFSGSASGSVDYDSINVGDFWNDKISSIRIYAGTWEFFEHANYQGSSFRLQPGNYCTLGNGWNDVISSFRQVQGTAPAAPPMGNDVADKVLYLSNLERSRAGVPALSLNSQMMKAAQDHTNLMVQHNQMSHQLPGEPSLGARVSQTGYRWSAIAENVASGQQTPDQVVRDWMNSPGHRANLLDPKYQHLGVGYANSFWTQVFGRS